MSKLSDRMRRAGRAESRPVGFTAAATAAQPSMLVVAALAAGETAGDTTADALLLPEGSTPEAVTAAAAAGAPVGVRAPKADRATVAALREAGADFFVLSDEAAASALTDEDASYILEIDGERTDTELRGLDGLAIEAVLAPAVDGALTIRRTINLRRLVAFTRKPLLLPVDPGMDAGDLEALRDMNVLLLLTPSAGVAQLRERVLAIPPRKRRDRSPVGVPTTLLTRSSMQTPDEDDGGEEE
jgi:hypothetical protein